MAFKPPEKFDFAHPEVWEAWRNRFQRFHVATKLGKEEVAVQRAQLIYAMGPEADRIYQTFTVEDDTTFDAVLKMFDEYFMPRKNVIHLRAVFNSRNQQSGESVEQYVRQLYELSEHADFDKKDDAIRDRLVLGLRV
mgnify:FL=1